MLFFVARQKGHPLRPRDGGNHTKETRKCRDIGNNSSCKSEDLITQETFHEKIFHPVQVDFLFPMKFLQKARKVFPVFKRFLCSP
jgi:hypothetical protein